MRSGVVLALVLAVGGGVGLAIGLGWNANEEPAPSGRGSRPIDPPSADHSGPRDEPEATALRHDNRRLRERIARLEKELAAPRPTPPRPPIDPAGRPPFRSDLLPGGADARILDPARLREIDRGNYQVGERILELRDGTEVRLQWAGIEVDVPLDPRLHAVSDRILVGRYTLDRAQRQFVADALADGDARSFETEGEAYRYARREIGEVASFHIETGDLDCAVVDLRPFAALPHVSSLEAELLDAVVEAKRVEPAIVAPIVSVRIRR